jgi:hypothetical protein
MMKWELVGETEVLGENLPHCHFVHHKSYMTWDRTRAVAVGSRQLTAWARMFYLGIINKTEQNAGSVFRWKHIVEWKK